MARGRCTFKQHDVTRALRAAAAAGVEVRIEIETDGRIVLVPIQADKPDERLSRPAPDIVL